MITWRLLHCFFSKKMAAFQNHKQVKLEKFSCLDDNFELQSLISNVVYAINKKNSPQSETLDYNGHLNDLHEFLYQYIQNSHIHCELFLQRPSLFFSKYSIWFDLQRNFVFFFTLKGWHWDFNRNFKNLLLQKHYVENNEIK